MSGSRATVLVLIMAGLPLAASSQRLALAEVRSSPDGGLDPVPGLPNAPGEPAGAGQAAQSVAGLGSIRGSVTDVNGGLVPGAKVVLDDLSHPAGLASEVSALSDSAGDFNFVNVKHGRYRVVVSSPGLRTFESPELVLAAGETRELPKITLPILSAVADVEVTATQVEIAQEQMRAEEKQRVFGVLPNFYTSYIWDAVPLTKGQKMHLAFKSATDPVEFLGAAVQAAAQYKAGSYAGYGYGGPGYAKRFAAAYGDGAIARVIGSGVLPSLLKQDPRYFYRGSGTKKSRALYAMTRAFVTRGDNGRPQPNYSHIGGAFLGGAISNAYHPHADRGVGLTITNGFIDTAGNAVNNLIREFLLKDLTPSVPDYANGKEAVDSKAKPSDLFHHLEAGLSPA